jgi:hypothetical protein
MVDITAPLIIYETMDLKVKEISTKKIVCVIEKPNINGKVKPTQKPKQSIQLSRL